MTEPLLDAAHLTLQVVSFLQSEQEVPRSPIGWTFVPTRVPWPGGSGYSSSEAAKYLEALPKPVLVGALNHPGLLAVWTAAALDPTEREYVSRLVANQVTGFSEILSQLDPLTPDIVLFEGWGTLTRVSVATCRQWLADYGLTWGWRLGAPTDGTHRARLFVLKGSANWSPGDSCAGP